MFADTLGCKNASDGLEQTWMLYSYTGARVTLAPMLLQCDFCWEPADLRCLEHLLDVYASIVVAAAVRYRCGSAVSLLSAARGDPHPLISNNGDQVQGSSYESFCPENR